VAEEGDADENAEEVNDGDVAEGDVSASHGEVPTVTEEPSIPSLKPHTPPPQPSEDITSASQVQPTPPQSPQVQPPLPQPQPQQDARILINLLQDLMDTYATLTRRVEHLEFDKVAQALEIIKLKRRVKKLERKNKVRKLKFRRLQRVGTSQNVETSDEIVLDDVSNQGKMIDEVDDDADVVLENDKEVTDEAKEIDVDHANKVLSMQYDETEPAEVQEVVDVVTTAKLITEVVTAASETVTAASAIIAAVEAQVPAATTVVTLIVAPARVDAAPSRRRKRVVIRDPESESTTSTIIHVETNSKDKGKEILDEDIDYVKIKAKEDPAVKKYQALKRKPQTEAQAKKNMMLYLKNVVGFKMDYFKGMSYDDIRPIFQAKFNSNMAFLLKTNEQIKEDENRALQRLNETPAERVAKRQKLDEEVEELTRHL
nr:hypothetical protein [Tanacetum cinerariifolium]